VRYAVGWRWSEGRRQIKRSCLAGYRNRVGLGLRGFSAWYMGQENERLKANLRRTAPVIEHPQPPQPQPHSVNLTNGATR